MTIKSQKKTKIAKKVKSQKKSKSQLRKTTTRKTPNLKGGGERIKIF